MADSTLALDVRSADGKKAGSVELPAALFDVKTNIPLIHQVVVAQRAAARQGTHSTKRRGEVSGAGRKPFKQKGTGNARQGSIRAPQMTGGGIVHGPKPRDYSQRTPKKMIAAALLGALSDRARGERLHVIESFGIEGAPSTKAAAAFLAERRRDQERARRHRARRRRHRQERPQPRVRPRAARSTSSTPTTCSSRTTSSSPRPPTTRSSRRRPAPPRRSRHDRRLNKDPRDIILKPVVSEKSYGLIDEGKYTFLVDPRATKTEIKLAIEKIFGVKVAAVNTINRVGKARRTRFGTGKRKDTKRAIVTPEVGHHRHLHGSRLTVGTKD